MDAVLAAFRFPSTSATERPTAEPLSGGLINQTYLIRNASNTPVAVLQRLHPVFGAQVNEDLDTVTQHLAANGLVTPRLVHTNTGARWFEVDGKCWRALTYVGGETVHAITDTRQAESAGALVGRFHRIMTTYSAGFVHVRGNVHDTAAHIAKLRAPCADKRDAGEFTDQALSLGADVLHSFDHVPNVFTAIARHVHGDLKISNILFETADTVRSPDASGPSCETSHCVAKCLIDLDTLGCQPLAYELGDMLRSWANPLGESTATPTIDVAIVGAALAGYASTAKGLFEPREYAAIIPGLELICVELACRFCVDIFDDSYFGWDASRFASRREHNLVRAKGQLALANSVANVRSELQSLCDSALA